MAHVMANRLVCHTLHESCRAVSHLRNCHRCGIQVWVSLVEDGGIEAGNLLPACRTCHRSTGQPVTINRPSLDVLATLGRREEGWRIIEERNNRDA